MYIGYLTIQPIIYIFAMRQWFEILQIEKENVLWLFYGFVDEITKINPENHKIGWDHQLLDKCV